MASRKERDSELVTAAKALDRELAAFAQAAEGIRRAPLASQRHIERAATLLNGTAPAQDALRERLEALLRALQAANAEREAQSAIVLARAGQIEARHAELRPLLAQYAALGERAMQVNARLAEPQEGVSVQARLDAADAELASLEADADALFTDAREAGFSDVQRLADALRQKLIAARAKLRKAARAILGERPK